MPTGLVVATGCLAGQVEMVADSDDRRDHKRTYILCNIQVRSLDPAGIGLLRPSERAFAWLWPERNMFIIRLTARLHVRPAGQRAVLHMHKSVGVGGEEFFQSSGIDVKRGGRYLPPADLSDDITI